MLKVAHTLSVPRSTRAHIFYSFTSTLYDFMHCAMAKKQHPLASLFTFDALQEYHRPVPLARLHAFWMRMWMWMWINACEVKVQHVCDMPMKILFSLTTKQKANGKEVCLMNEIMQLVIKTFGAFFVLMLQLILLFSLLLRLSHCWRTLHAKSERGRHFGRVGLKITKTGNVI